MPTNIERYDGGLVLFGGLRNRRCKWFILRTFFALLLVNTKQLRIGEHAATPCDSANFIFYFS